MSERRHVEPARTEPDVRRREEVEVLTRCIPHRRDRIRHAVRELMRLTRLGVVDWPAPPGAEPGRMRVQRPQKGEGSRMRKRHKPEQIVRRLREADALLSAGGATIADACRRLEVSEATYHRWRKQHSGMEIQTLKRL